jgi:hypothetical protein
MVGDELRQLVNLDYQVRHDECLAQDWTWLQDRQPAPMSEFTQQPR